MPLSKNQFQAEFYRRHPLVESFFTVFEHFPNVFLYVKDTLSRFVHINQPLLATYQLQDEKDVVGKTDRDFYPPALARAYIEEDRHIFQTGKAILGKLWLVPHIEGTPHWYVSSKAPLFDAQGKIVGLAGVMFRVERPSEKERYFGRLQLALDYLETNFASSVSMSDAAKRCHLPLTTFNRQFRELLRMTPTEYLLARRIDAARNMLVGTQRSISDIAAECGFADQSHFTKRFRKITELTPLAYRKRLKG